jgi:hypothetical protein
MFQTFITTTRSKRWMKQSEKVGRRVNCNDAWHRGEDIGPNPCRRVTRNSVFIHSRIARLCSHVFLMLPATTGCHRTSTPLRCEKTAKRFTRARCSFSLPPTETFPLRSDRTRTPPGEVGMNFSEAIQLARDTGYTHYCCFTQRTRKNVPF